MHHKRGLLVPILFIAVMVLLLSACSSRNTEQKLSEMEDSELIQYIADSGVTVPESVSVDTVRGIIVELENDPEHSAPIMSYTVVTDLYEDLCNLVVEYASHKE